MNYQEKAKQMVAGYMSRGSGDKDVTIDDLYVVWFCKTLKNWKALVSTDLVKGVYFEVTYNGDKKETYLDKYGKAELLAKLMGDTDYER